MTAVTTYGGSVSRRTPVPIFIGILLTVLSVAAPPASADVPVAHLLRISLGTLAANGALQANDASYTPSVSADGRWVAFSSDASNLVPGDFNHSRDVFLRDTTTGAIRRVSVSSAGQQGNADSYNPSISGDGRYVVYDSFASNLVPGDTNRQGDVFLYDRDNRSTTRISVRYDGAQTDAQSGFGVISKDGNTIAFESRAAQVIKGVTSPATQLYAYDRAKKTTDLISAAFLGGPAGGGSGALSLSDDGRYVAFSSSSADLVPYDVNQRDDIFVRDRQSSSTRRVSVNGVGGEANGASAEPAISGDGRYVAFESQATNLLGLDPTFQDDPKSIINPEGKLDTGDTNNVPDVFVRDLQTGSIERASVSASGQEADADSYGAAISGDGRYVAFVSLATNLVPGDTNRVREVFVRDRTAHTTLRVAISDAGLQGNKLSVMPALSRDGTVVVFASDASTLVLGDTNHESDIFLRRL
jgi:Tol biopolymer transport system component